MVRGNPRPTAQLPSTAEDAPAVRGNSRPTEGQILAVGTRERDDSPLEAVLEAPAMDVDLLEIVELAPTRPPDGACLEPHGPESPKVAQCI